MSVLMVFVPSACRWNHAFKNQITTLQSQAKNRANPNRSEVQANLSLFLEAASGFYTQVRFRQNQLVQVQPGFGTVYV